MRTRRRVLTLSIVILTGIFSWALWNEATFADAENYLEDVATGTHYDTLGQALGSVQTGDDVEFKIYGTVTGDSVSFSSTLSEGTKVTFTPADDGAVLDTQLTWSSNATAVFNGCTVGKPVTFTRGSIQMNQGTKFRAETTLQNVSVLEDIKGVSFDTTKVSAHALTLQNTPVNEISGCSFLSAPNSSYYGLKLLNTEAGSITGNTFNGELTIQGKTTVAEISDQTFTAPTSQRCISMIGATGRQDNMSVGIITDCTFRGSSNQPAIELDSDDTIEIEIIEDCSFTGKYGLRMKGTGNNNIERIGNCSFQGNGRGIDVYKGSILIADGITTSTDSTSIDMRSGGSIETLINSNITSRGGSATGINLNGDNTNSLARIGSIVDTNVSASNGIALKGNAEIEEILNGTDGTKTITGSNFGIYNQSTIGTITNMTINGGNGIHMQGGRIDTLDHVIINSTGGGNTSAGISLDVGLGTDPRDSSIGTIDTCEITALGSGIYSVKQSAIDKIDNSQIRGEQKGIHILANSKISEITGSAIKGAIGLDGVNSEYTNVKDSILTGGTTGVSGSNMTYTLSGSNVVYGDNYAINVLLSTVNLEPELKSGLGNGRYLGGTGQVLGNTYSYPVLESSNTPYQFSESAKYETDYTEYDVNQRKYHALVAPVSLTYDSNGGEGEITGTEAVTGDSYTIWQEGDEGGFERTGFVLTGFNSKSDGTGDDYDFGSEIVLEDNITLYAQWEEKTYNVTVSNDGNGTGTADPTSGKKGTEVTITATPIEGYVFAGWQVISGGVTLDDQDSGTTVFTIDEADVEVKATFAPIPIVKHTITYKLNGGQYNGSTADIVEEHEKGTTAKAHAAPTREGYTFLYWEGSKYYPGDDITVDGDHILTAQWQQNEPTDPTDPTTPTDPTGPTTPTGSTTPSNSYAPSDDHTPDDSDPSDDGDERGSKNSAGDSSARTGDETALYIWFITMLAALTGTVAVACRRRNYH